MHQHKLLKKDIGKNSKLKRKNKQETFVKDKIKNKTENIGFLEIITKKEDKIEKLDIM